MTTWHIITCEYPPQQGGVSDYCQLLAGGLAGSGELVQVWCPPADSAHDVPGVIIRRELGDLGLAALGRAGRLLDREMGPRRLLVQWVPHGYGWRSMNLPFCLWVARRVQRGDYLELMVHEAALSFSGSPRRLAAALVHRAMLMVLLRAASAVWLATPAWEGRCRPYLFGRSVPFAWLPIPSTISPVVDAEATAAIRRRHAPIGTLVGRFGNHGPVVDRLLEATLPLLLDRRPDASVLLIGGGSDNFCSRFIRRYPKLTGRVSATGRLGTAEVSHHLAACDVLLQPVPEGVTSRNTSVMAGIAHGKAVVTTPSDVTEPLWGDSEAVLLSAPDPSALAEAVARLLADNALRLRVGVLATALYADRFDLSHTIRVLRAGLAQSEVRP